MTLSLGLQWLHERSEALITPFKTPGKALRFQGTRLELARPNDVLGGGGVFPGAGRFDRLMPDEVGMDERSEAVMRVPLACEFRGCRDEA